MRPEILARMAKETEGQGSRETMGNGSCGSRERCGGVTVKTWIQC